MMEYMVSGSRNSPPFTTELEMNRYLQGVHVSESINNRKTTSIQKDPIKGTAPLKLQTHNLPTDAVKNINSKNKGRDFQLANKPQVVTWGRERMLQRIQRYRIVTLHWSTYPKREQDQTEKSSYGLDWLQTCMWYGSTKLDKKLPQIIQNIRRSRKLYREKHENLESEIDSRRKKLSWSKCPQRYISRRCTITVTIHNCHYAT